jgi:hypothetical protein
VAALSNPCVASRHVTRSLVGASSADRFTSKGALT